jgi:hypothetical protein
MKRTKYIIGYDDGDGKTHCGLCVMRTRDTMFLYSTANRTKAKVIIWLFRLFGQTITVEK